MRDTCERRPRWTAAALVVALACILPSASWAEERGGTMLLFPAGPGCSWSPQCSVWRMSCDPARASEDGVDTSIANIPASFRNTIRVYRATGTRTDPGGLTYFSYYDAFCREVDGGVPLYPGVPLGKSHSHKVPIGARWISVHGYRATQVSWTLK